MNLMSKKFHEIPYHLLRNFRKNHRFVDKKFYISEIGAVQKNAHLVDIEKC